MLEQERHNVEKRPKSFPFYDFSAWLNISPETHQPYFDLHEREGRVQFAEEVIRAYVPDAQVTGLQLHVQPNENGYLMKVVSDAGSFYLKILNTNNFARSLDLDDGEMRAKTQVRKLLQFIGRYHHPTVAQSQLFQPIIGFFHSETEGFSGYVMPEYEGGSLEDRHAAVKLRQQGQENETAPLPLTWPEQVSAAKRFLGTLVAYEDIGVTHRDLKSENVFFHRQRAVVGDQDYMGFDNEPLTQGKMNGFTTMWYMAPEIMEALGDGREPVANQKTEQYSAALVLYRMLSRGRYFFSGDSSWDEKRFQKFITDSAFRENWITIGHIVGKKKGHYYDLTKIFFAAEPDDESRELSPLYKACQKVDTVLKKASALDPQERYETMRDFALEFVAALTALVELVNTLQVHESQDPLWIDVGTSVGRQRSRYEAIMPGAETAVSDKKKKQLPFSRAVLGRIIKSLGGKVPDEK